jgi:hypothetical protein
MREYIHKDIFISTIISPKCDPYDVRTGTNTGLTEARYLMVATDTAVGLSCGSGLQCRGVG